MIIDVALGILLTPVLLALIYMPFGLVGRAMQDRYIKQSERASLEYSRRFDDWIARLKAAEGNPDERRRLFAEYQTWSV